MLFRSMEKYDYLNVARELKNFYWEEYCDWYLEITKIRLYDENIKDKITPKVVLLYILENYLRLLHPIMPHLTEALWQNLPESVREGPALIVAQWPTAEHNFIDEDKESNVAKIIDIIRSIRRVRSDFNVPAASKIPIMIECGDQQLMVDRLKKELITLANLSADGLKLAKSIDAPKHAARIVLHGLTTYIPLEGVIDMKTELARMEKQLSSVGDQITKVQKKLDSPFSSNAAPEVVEAEREKLKEYELRKSQIQEQIAILK